MRTASRISSSVARHRSSSSPIFSYSSSEAAAAPSTETVVRRARGRAGGTRGRRTGAGQPVAVALLGLSVRLLLRLCLRLVLARGALLLLAGGAVEAGGAARLRVVGQARHLLLPAHGARVGRDHAISFVVGRSSAEQRRHRRRLPARRGRRSIGCLGLRRLGARLLALRSDPRLHGLEIHAVRHAAMMIESLLLRRRSAKLWSCSLSPLSPLSSTRLHSAAGRLYTRQPRHERLFVAMSCGGNVGGSAANARPPDPKAEPNPRRIIRLSFEFCPSEKKKEENYR